jgi:hypothetical protein
MKPARSILSKDFKYVSAANTDLRKTFERLRRLRQAEKAKVVVPMNPKREAKA